MESQVEADSVIGEVAPQQETEAHDVVSQEQAPEAQASSTEESRQTANFKAMREKQKDLERELRMQREMNERLLQMTSQTAPQKAPPPPDELDTIDDEEYIPKGKVRKLANKDAREIAKEVVREEFKRQQSEQFMDRLKKKFSDFDEVVNAETLSLLEQRDPELAQVIADVKDPYTIGLQSYKYIKSMGLADKVPQERHAREVDKKISSNAKTVQTPQAYDKRPMAQAFRMSEAESKALYEEMMGFAAQADAVPQM